MFEIRRYSEDYKEAWNEFVRHSKNGTFLFDRNYMDYHSDRFCDCSLLFYSEDTLRALLPANVNGDTLYSHQGLTYGSLITDDNISAAETVTLFHELNDYLHTNDIKKVQYKCIPWIYHKHPAEEDLYAIFRECNAKLIARDISSTIVMSNKIKWHRDRKYGINKTANNGITVERSDDFRKFWYVLNNNLSNKYGVRPVHTIDEIELLKSLFPDNIILYVAHKDDVVYGGTVLYITDKVVHAQYISASPEGKHLRVIDAIYNVILNRDFTDYQYFDFGKSTEEHGHYLNESLIYQKEGFGGRGVCYDTYEWEL